jgi:hypothetical protein
VQLLIATSHSLLVVDSEDGLAQVVSRDRDLSYHGLALSSDAIFVAARDRLPTPNGELAKEAPGKILVYDYGLAQRDALVAPFPMRQLHQIGYHAGCLYAACTFDNMVAVHDGAAWTKWYPLPDKRDEDINHFNSILIRDGHIYIMAHNYNRGPSQVLDFDLATRRLLDRFDLGYQAHNLWIAGGDVYACDSAHGWITSRRQQIVHETGGFPRGVAVAKRRSVVGVSELTVRKNREYTSGRLLVYAPRFRLLRTIVLEREGMVHDLCAPGTPDLCRPEDRGQVMRLPAHLPSVRFPVEHAERSRLRLGEVLERFSSAFRTF